MGLRTDLGEIGQNLTQTARQSDLRMAKMGQNAGYERHMSRSLVVVQFGLDNFATTVIAAWADVVAAVYLVCVWIHCQTRHHQGIVRAMHTALGWRFLVLLNGHVRFLEENGQ